MSAPNAPIKDNKVYGDEASLQRLKATGTTLPNGEMVPTIDRPVGRPAGPGAPQPTAPVAPVGVEESQYSDYYHRLGRSVRAAAVAQNAARDIMAGPWLRQYAGVLQELVEERGREVRDVTPFTEE